MHKDLVRTGLIFTIVILFGVILKNNYNIKLLNDEIKDTKDVVYYVSDKLDIAYDMIDSLNEEQALMQNEINEMKDVKRITKELR